MDRNRRRVRQTLGPLHHLNSIDDPSNKTTSRRSLATTFGESSMNRPVTKSVTSRRSGFGTISFSGTSNGAPKDRRPISDKFYIASCVRKIVEYLINHGYDQPISNKILTRPSRKDFENILRFLFYKLDPHYQYGQKFEEDIIYFFKNCKYPFNISKTALVAVGSTQSWPALLAAMTWLVEGLEYDEVASSSLYKADGINTSDKDTNSIVNDNLSSDKKFFFHIKNSYKTFLSGDDEACKSLENAFLLEQDEIDNIKKLKIEELKKKQEEIKKKIDEMKEDENSVAQKHQIQRDYIKDEKKLSELVISVKAAINKADEKKNLKLEEIKQQVEEIRNIKEKNDTLLNRINKQTICKSDVDDMKEKKNGLQDKYQHIVEKTDKISLKIKEEDTKINTNTKQIQDSIDNYNFLMQTKLKMIPSSAKNAHNKNYEIKNNIFSGNNNNNTDEEENQIEKKVDICNKLVDFLKRSLRDDINKLIEIKKEKKKDANDEGLDWSGKAAAIKQSLLLESNNYNEVQKLIERSDDTKLKYETEADKILEENEEKALQLELELERLSSLDDEKKKEINQLQAEYEKSKTATEEHKQKCRDESLSLKKIFMQKVLHYIEHKEKINKKLDNMEEFMVKLCEDEFTKEIP